MIYFYHEIKPFNLYPNYLNLNYTINPYNVVVVNLKDAALEYKLRTDNKSL